jgi:hypothetical protein
MFRRWSHSHEKNETIVRRVLDAVRFSRAREHRLAGPQTPGFSRDLETGVTLEHDVVLGALLVNVDFLTLSRLETIDVEEEVRGGEEIHLLHLLGGEAAGVENGTDIHGSPPRVGYFRAFR